MMRVCFSLTGRIIKSYTDSAAKEMGRSAINVEFCEVTIFVDLSTEATTTLTFARRNMSTRITISIPSEPFATGMRTCLNI